MDRRIDMAPQKVIKTRFYWKLAILFHDISISCQKFIAFLLPLNKNGIKSKCITIQ